MDATRMKTMMEQQVESLDFIKGMLSEEEETGTALADNELAVLKDYVSSIDLPWHIMLKLAKAKSDSEASAKKKKDKTEKTKDIFDDTGSLEGDLDFLD